MVAHRGGLVKTGRDAMKRVTELLGSRYPIIQGAMGVICNPELVAAVSEAGGFGLLATAFARDPERVRSQVRATRALTQKPFGANLLVMNPLSPAFARVLAEEGVKVVTVSGGAPKEIVPLLRELGIKAVAVVPTVEAALGAEALGVQAIVAEGTESGGLQGFKGASTMVLVPAVVDAVKLPVIAAGGIADSRGVRAALALGADGVQVGTRFIATQECVAHADYKERIVGSSEAGTVLVTLGRVRVRALRTGLAQEIMEGARTPGFSSPEAMEKAWIEGDLDAGLLPAGEVVGLVSRVASVREVIEEMAGGLTPS
jgi:enoyl-[acyl-carrier protein] reductase II